MRSFRRRILFVGLTFALLISLAAAAESATGQAVAAQTGPSVVGGGYAESDLVTNLRPCVPVLTDRFGIVHHASLWDPNLVNPWGMAEGPASPLWVSDNGSGSSSLYSIPGANNTAVSANSLVVSIPSPGDLLGDSGSPTGAVFNPALAQGAFKISGFNQDGDLATAPAVFLFATEDGTIVGWNPGINPSGFDPAKAGTYGTIAIDKSANPSVTGGAVYKGLAVAADPATGASYLFAANFRSGAVEAYDSSLQQVSVPPGAFTDPALPAGYAPFNIVLIGGKLFVTYAKQDAARHDDVAGQGHGFVDTFDLTGKLLARFHSGEPLDSPWGVALAPSGFGRFGGDILIGNFGDGRINAFDPATGQFAGRLSDSSGKAIRIDGLWGLRFGNGVNGGDPNTLYFTAGPNNEQDGLLGNLSPSGL